MTQTDSLDPVVASALSFLADARLVDVATHFGVTTVAAAELIGNAALSLAMTPTVDPAVAALAAEFPYGWRYVYSRTVGGQEMILTVVGWQAPDLVVSLMHDEATDERWYGDVNADVMRRLPRPS